MMELYDKPRHIIIPNVIEDSIENRETANRLLAYGSKQANEKINDFNYKASANRRMHKMGSKRNWKWLGLWML